MSFRLVRSSKFRHVYGTCLKREQCFDNIRVSKASWDSTFCAVNPKFCAIIVESGGGGAFIVLPLSKLNKASSYKKATAGRIAADHPLVGGHKGPVLDLAWDPFNDNVIASGSDDCLVKIWQIPEYGLVTSLTESVVDLQYHQRRVSTVLWHPTASNVLLSAGQDNIIVIWNVQCAEPLNTIDVHTDHIYSCCFNWDGSLLLTTCKDKKIRIINPRNSEVFEEATSHEGAKGARAIFLKNGLVFTTGFSRRSERQYSLRAPGHMHDPITQVELDSSNGVMFPVYDPDTNLVFLCGKGDSVIRYFEISADVPFVHYINTFQLPDPQRGIGVMPKRGVDVNSCEIMRFYRLNNNGFCQIISMTVPRKSELFQEDLYPDTPGDIAALTAEEWWDEGRNAEPLLMSLKGGYTPTEKGALKVQRRAPKSEARSAESRDVKDAPAPSKGGGGDPAAAENAQKALDQVEQVTKSNDELKKKIEELQTEMKKFKAVFLKQENRIRSLEGRLTSMADQQPKEEEGQQSSSPPQVRAEGGMAEDEV